ncbi:MAG TPA: glycosyltransferase family 2 protein [Bryobacteraceae bacterium]|jgi:cellulose synthase/poly-beta-1,6-N-acetylglucosamine synthase-like glycosyltransferase|nr:glycosyltransferase family 2 protein [Bryobacteraceae bacterium]
MILEQFFWCSIAVVIYVYVGYPAVLLLLGLLIRRAPRKAPVEPSVSMLVAAYNEAEIIEKKIENALALDYPPDRLEIVIASDGSTDATVALASRFTDDPRVRVIAYPKNRGKISVLNQTVPQLRGEIVVFSDAASMLLPDALRKLMASFADPQVGGVSGLYSVHKTEQADIGSQEAFYWKYETFLKMQEGTLASVLGAHGSLYAIRRKLYPFPDKSTINDDYVIPLRVVQQGHRVVYEPGAISYEEAQEMGGFHRRVRIMAGNIQQLREIQFLIWPPRPLPLFFFLSHKAGRVIVPWCMLLAIFCNLLLINRPLYQVLAVAQVGFYGLALLGAGQRLRPRSLGLPYYFCMINAAGLLALCRMLGVRKVVWK